MDNLRDLSNFDLLRLVDQVAENERRSKVEMIACLAEVHRRSLDAELPFGGLFEYCTNYLQLSRGAAYRRMHVVKAANRFPEIFSDLKAGTLSICIVAHVVSELGLDSLPAALPHCRGKSLRQVEEWAAARLPPQPARDRVVVRAPLPAPPAPILESEGSMFGVPAPAAPPPVPAYSYSFTASADLHRAIERLKNLLWSKHPFGSLDDFLKIAVVEYVERHDPSLIKMPKPAKPVVADSRRVLTSVRNVVWARDGGRCAYVVAGGRRCEARRGLEIDHVTPYSLGGRSDDPNNLRLLCREHNQLERRRILGEGDAPGAREGLLSGP